MRAQAVPWTTLPTTQPLNSDVLYRVFELGGAGARALSNDYATLLACSLVCKSWAAQAQPILFRHVSFTHCKTGSRRPLRRFLSALQKCRASGRRIPDTVRSIVLFVGNQPPRDRKTSGTTIYHADIHFAALALAMCPNLRSLHFTLLPDSSRNAFDPQEIALLRSLSALTTLDLRVHDPFSPITYQLLDAWGTISNLRIERFPLLPPPANLALGPALRQLECGAQPPPSFIALLERSPSEITSLVLTEVDNFELCVKPLRASLQTLVVRHITSSPRTARMHALAECTALRTVIFDCEATAQMMLSMPVTVQHIALHAHPAALRDLPNVLASRPQLRTITLVVRDGESLPDISYLWARGVDLNVMNSHQLRKTAHFLRI